MPGPARVPPAPGTAGTFPTLNISFCLSSSPSGRSAAKRDGDEPAGSIPAPSASPPNPRAENGLKNQCYKTSQAATLFVALKKTSQMLGFVQIGLLALEKCLCKG